MSRVKARQKRRDRGEAITSRPTQGRGNNHEAEARPRRGIKTSGEAEAALLLPRGETFASRHIYHWTGTSIMIQVTKSLLRKFFLRPSSDVTYGKYSKFKMTAAHLSRIL